MNNKLSTVYLILIVAALLLSCHEPAKDENKNTAPVSTLSLHVGNNKYLQVNTKESVITWKGSSLNGLNTQTGYVFVSKGELRIEDGQLTAGTIEIDMNTIEDKNHGTDNKLVNHLKNPDFFDVKRFPFATIAITKVASLNSKTKNVTGNLTIKGITHPVTFPVEMQANGQSVEANGKLVIDRTLWDIRYKSAKFYSNLANQTMSDFIEFKIKIVAKT